jgi:hypothetical protein
MSEESSSRASIERTGVAAPPPPPFQSLDLRSASGSMEHLFEQVLRRTGRVEITRQGESCVLISKAELDGIEQALEILSSTDSGVAMRDGVLRAAAATMTCPARVATAGTV